MGGATYLFTPGEEYNGKHCSFQLPKIFTTDTVNEFAQKKQGPIYWLPVCEVSKLNIEIILNCNNSNTVGNGFCQN